MPLDAGVYETRVSGGASLLIVNASRELLPRRANVRTGAVGGAAPFGDQPHLRDYHWIYLLLLGRALRGVAASTTLRIAMTRAARAAA